MASANQSGVIPLPQAIDKYFDLCLYLLVLTGFGTLASTGGLDLPTILLVGMALAFRGYLLAEKRRLVISERWTTPLSMAYFLFYAGDYLLLSRSFLAATVHLVLFGVVVRTFSLRRERDHTMLAILAFLMVLASAVLTVDSVFLFCFAAFLMVAVATFILMEMRSSGKSAQMQARHTSDPQEHRHLALSLVRVTPALMGMILLGAMAVFFVLPRMSAAGYLGAYSFGQDLSTGFSDHVQLGQIGQIQQSNSVVMHIQIDGDQVGRYDLHWRGVSLSQFDGASWSNPRTHYMLQRQMDGSFGVPAFGQGVSPDSAGQGVPHQNESIIHYRVLMEPIGTNVFFLAPWARSVGGVYRVLSTDSGGAVYDLDSSRSISRYEADSDVSTPSPDQLRAASKEDAPPVSPGYLRLPPLDARIPQLARQIAGSASNDYDRATALERYLKTHYGYTLQLPRTPVSDPIANFLFERKQGHCEYFASSLAVMLRTLKIPSRVVNGFRSNEFNDLTHNYVVRARDAHAWVEAYFPGYGWITFDPTPGGAAGTPHGWDRLALYLDAAASFWREWVISYDSAHQYVLGQTALSSSRNLWEQSRGWARLHYDRMLNWARHSEKRVERSPLRWSGLAAAAAGLLLLVANLSRFARWVRIRRLQAHPERSPMQAATMWYMRMQRLLSRRGIERPPAQTPQEFARIIPDAALKMKIQQFTDNYELARFGHSGDDAQRLPELYEEIELALRN